MDTNDLADRLAHLGLTSYEARAYLALVRRDSYTAAQVARLAGLPRQRIYDVLGSLVEKGLASSRPGTRREVRGDRPGAGGRAAPRAAPRASWSTSSATAPTIIDALTPGVRRPARRTPIRSSTSRCCATAARSTSASPSSRRSVKHEILVFTKPPYATPPQENVEGIEVTRTHVARSVYEFSVFDDPATTEGVRRFIEAGEEARFVDELPLKLVIIDETIVMFGMEDPVAGTPDLTIMVVEHPVARAASSRSRSRRSGRTGLTFDAGLRRLRPTTPSPDRLTPSDPAPDRLAARRSRWSAGSTSEREAPAHRGSTGAGLSRRGARRRDACARPCLRHALGCGGRRRPTPQQSTRSKLRGDLAALVAGTTPVDPRLARWSRAHRPGELAVLRVAERAGDAARRHAGGGRCAGPAHATARSTSSRRGHAGASRRSRVLVGRRPGPDRGGLALGASPAEPRRTPTWRSASQPSTRPRARRPTSARRRSGTRASRARASGSRSSTRAWTSRTRTSTTSTSAAGRGLLNAAKVVDARNFIGGACAPGRDRRRHGHGTHVAGIAAGTGEGDAARDDNGRYAGIAPDAELAVGQGPHRRRRRHQQRPARRDGVGGDAGRGPSACAIGAHVVNLSLGSESRPSRLNTGSDVDLVSLMLNRLAGPLRDAVRRRGREQRAVHRQRRSRRRARPRRRSASARRRRTTTSTTTTRCPATRAPAGGTRRGGERLRAGVGDAAAVAQRRSRRAARRATLWLRPDVAAPGYNIVSAQARDRTQRSRRTTSTAARAPIRCTRPRPGRRWRRRPRPVRRRSCCEAYRERHGAMPSGASGLAGLARPRTRSLRAALMNTAGGDLFEARWILSTDARDRCRLPARARSRCLRRLQLRRRTSARSLGRPPPLRGPQRRRRSVRRPARRGRRARSTLGRALAALRDGVVVYSAASGAAPTRAPGRATSRAAGRSGRSPPARSRRRASSSTPRRARRATQVRFAFVAGNPSDGSQAIVRPARRLVGHPARATSTVRARRRRGREAQGVGAVERAAPGLHGRRRRAVSNGQTLRIPVFASVALHDPNTARQRRRRRRPGSPRRATSSPSPTRSGRPPPGAAGTGAGSDWLVSTRSSSASGLTRGALQRLRRGGRRRDVRPLRLRRRLRPAREHASVRRGRRDRRRRERRSRPVDRGGPRCWP